MKFEALNASAIIVPATPAATTYETRIKSDGKVEATDTITKVQAQAY